MLKYQPLAFQKGRTCFVSSNGRWVSWRKKNEDKSACLIRAMRWLDIIIFSLCWDYEPSPHSWCCGPENKCSLCYLSISQNPMRVRFEGWIWWSAIHVDVSVPMYVVNSYKRVRWGGGRDSCGHLEVKTYILRHYIKMVEAEVLLGQMLWDIDSLFSYKGVGIHPCGSCINEAVEGFGGEGAPLYRWLWEPWAVH